MEGSPVNPGSKPLAAWRLRLAAWVLRLLLWVATLVSLLALACTATEPWWQRVHPGLEVLFALLLYGWFYSNVFIGLPALLLFVCLWVLKRGLGKEYLPLRFYSRLLALQLVAGIVTVMLLLVR
ncbi:hypothetical protein [Flaviaesturariibacter amylovorans]|uniref:Uncharacterized protein n=1 Tax=Flaviaesturariibacter amylovorans TaxID=1084520 RepID=A0ABP8H4A9_9BACT